MSVQEDQPPPPRYVIRRYGGSWIVWDARERRVVALRPDEATARAAAVRLNATEGWTAIRPPT